MARPKSKLDLPKGWQEKVLDLYKEGASDVEIKALIYTLRGSYSNNLWERWMKEEEEFWETVKMGRILSRAWWESKGRTGLTIIPGKPTLNYTGWYMNMKNRFGWADKQEIKEESAQKIIIEERIIGEGNNS